MRFWPKKLGKDEYVFYSDKKPEDLRSEINSYFNSGFLDMNTLIAGRFLRTGEFVMTNRWSFVDIGGYNTFPVYLRGVIYDYEDGSKISVFVNTNILFKIFFYACLFFGIFALFYITKNTNWYLIFKIELALVVIFPIAILFMAQTFKRRLKEKIVFYLDLSSTNPSV